MVVLLVVYFVYFINALPYKLLGTDIIGLLVIGLIPNDDLFHYEFSFTRQNISKEYL